MYLYLQVPTPEKMNFCAEVYYGEEERTLTTKETLNLGNTLKGHVRNLNATAATLGCTVVPFGRQRAIRQAVFLAGQRRSREEGALTCPSGTHQAVKKKKKSAHSGLKQPTN